MLKHHPFISTSNSTLGNQRQGNPALPRARTQRGVFTHPQDGTPRKAVKYGAPAAGDPNLSAALIMVDVCSVPRPRDLPPEVFSTRRYEKPSARARLRFSPLRPTTSKRISWWQNFSDFRTSPRTKEVAIRGASSQELSSSSDDQEGPSSFRKRGPQCSFGAQRAQRAQRHSVSNDPNAYTVVLNNETPSSSTPKIASGNH